MKYTIKGVKMEMLTIAESLGNQGNVDPSLI